jgi:hypothetical protein
MKRLIITLVLLITATALAAEKDRQVPTKQPEKTTTKQQDEKKAPEWPRPYKTTEQISADSVVPFPVDI